MFTGASTLTECSYVMSVIAIIILAYDCSKIYKKIQGRRRRLQLIVIRRTALRTD